MNFFIPEAEDDAHAERVYADIKAFNETMGWPVTDRRIFAITYLHGGREYHAEVGQPDPRVGEIVVAILDSKAYLVCTGNRGVVRGAPILVGPEEMLEITDFS